MDAPAPQDDEFPWWLVAVLALAGYAFWHVLSDSLHRQILVTLLKGVKITVFVTLVSFALASGVGLLLALGSSSRWRLVRQSARFYVEIVRGVPILVLLLYVAFVLAPALVELANWIRGGLGFDPVRSRDFPLLWRAVLALVIAYSAFISEVFRAGFASVPAGQIEAAKALGLSGLHRFRFIVFPQAIRVVLPPLGNDFVALVKDSSLVSVAWRAGRDATGQGDRREQFSLLRNLQCRRTHLPGNHDQPFACIAAAGAPLAEAGRLNLA